MSIKKHTPGPWSVVRRQGGTFVEAGNHYTAKIYGSETQPDASLIASAPELLEALEALLVRHPGGSDDSMCHRGFTTKEECETCRPVLAAKALVSRLKGG